MPYTTLLKLNMYLATLFAESSSLTSRYPLKTSTNHTNKIIMINKLQVISIAYPIVLCMLQGI